MKVGSPHRESPVDDPRLPPTTWSGSLGSSAHGLSLTTFFGGGGVGDIQLSIFSWLWRRGDPRTCHSVADMWLFSERYVAGLALLIGEVHPWKPSLARRIPLFPRCRFIKCLIGQKRARWKGLGAQPCPAPSHKKMAQHPADEGLAFSVLTYKRVTRAEGRQDTPSPPEVLQTVCACTIPSLAHVRGRQGRVGNGKQKKVQLKQRVAIANGP